MLLKEWLLNKGCDEFTNRLEKYSNIEIVSEISSVTMGYDEYLKIRVNNAPFKEKNVHCFVILSNGYAIGCNENPSRGLSFPIIKYK